MKLRQILSLLNILLLKLAFAQQELTSKQLEQSAIRFELNEAHSIVGDAKGQILTLVGQNQFIGIAEVHNSEQLSYFTTCLLELLKQKGFNNFALEMGPHSAKILQEISSVPDRTSEEIRNLNRTYGKNWHSKIPLVFVDKKSDALFVEKAASLGYSFWGLDQEYAGSFEMHIDQIFKLVEVPTSKFQADYQAAKAAVRKNIFKNKVKGQSVYCWYQSDETIADFFKHFEQNEEAMQVIKDLRISWDIYCNSATGVGSNQQRANYMKQNFQAYYVLAKEQESSPKVFVKLGGVHLTHGLSPFGVDDMGKFLHEKSKEEGTGFLTIRNLIAFKNGKSNIGKSGWKSVGMFLELGRKDQWTMVDLRPAREKVLSGEWTTNDNGMHELTSYDLLLIPPDDRAPKINYK